MEFNIAQRLTLLNLLPQQGDIVNMRVVRDTQKELGFTDEELVEFGIEYVNDGQSIRWRTEADKAKEVPLGSRAKVLVLEALDKLSGDGNLTVPQLEIYEMLREKEDA